MVNKCSAPECRTGYASVNTQLATFHFPLKKIELNRQWIRFVNRTDWEPTKNSVLCELHFEDKLKKRGKKCNLRWAMSPVPTINSAELSKTPSVLPSPQTSREPPRKRIFQEDELDRFRNQDSVKSIADLNEIVSPPGFQFRRFENSVMFYRLEFNEQTQFPTVLESIRVHKDLHVQLQYNGVPRPLPQWFVKGHNAKLVKLSMLENFPTYIKLTATENQQTLLQELRQRELYKPKGRPPFSTTMIRYALHLRYTSLQSYKLILKKFPMPSISLLNKIQQGGVDSLKALRTLHERGQISRDLVLMVDEMYLQKATQYQGGEYVGADEEGNMYKGIVAFMVVGLKKSIPYVVQAIPEVSFTGRWLSEQIADNIENLARCGFCVRALVTDNHSANVNAFNSLKNLFNSDSSLFIKHPINHGKRTYMFFDAVHLVKNVRNNLLNGKKFVFPEFKYNDHLHISLNCPAGYVSWRDLYDLYDRDKELKGNLRKAPKLSYQVLHPGNNKQSVPLALAIIHETTIAASKSYYPNRPDISNFLTIFNTWWTISNSKQRFSPNILGHGIVLNDKKTEYFHALANWIEEWSQSPSFKLTSQTASALINTLRSQAMLIDELLNDGYDFVLTARLQSDPIERRFSQYRQMSGGRFLVSLREVLNSERILSCRSLIKENVNFWEEDLQPDTFDSMNEIDEALSNRREEILESFLDSDSSEVGTTISGYVGKKLAKRSKCVHCKEMLNVRDEDLEHDTYLSLLSRGGLFVPSKKLAEFVCTCFAILDFVEEDILQLSRQITKAATYVLKNYGPPCEFCCNEHNDWGNKFATKIIVNIYFNNKQKQSKDEVRKDAVSGFKTRQRSAKNLK